MARQHDRQRVAAVCCTHCPGCGRPVDPCRLQGIGHGLAVGDPVESPPRRQLEFGPHRLEWKIERPALAGEVVVELKDCGIKNLFRATLPGRPDSTPRATIVLTDECNPSQSRRARTQNEFAHRRRQRSLCDVCHFAHRSVLSRSNHSVPVRRHPTLDNNAFSCSLQTR